ncbi:MAG: nucleotide excision repair endonuclease [Paraclostridium sp.]
MAYTYRFKDINGNIIYIGKTVNLDRRIHDHFNKGHLPKECYQSVAVIEYQKHKTESDSLIWETYYITKYSPKYNKLQKSRDMPTLELEEKEWKLYKQFKHIEPRKVANTGIWRVVAVGYLVYIILYYLMRLF